MINKLTLLIGADAHQKRAIPISIFSILFVLAGYLPQTACKPITSHQNSSLYAIEINQQLISAVERLGNGLVNGDEDLSKPLKDVIEEVNKINSSSSVFGTTAQPALLNLTGDQRATMKVLWERFGSAGGIYAENIEMLAGTSPDLVSYPNLRNVIAAAMVQLIGPNGSHTPGNIGHLEAVFLDAVINDIKSGNGSNNIRVMQSAFNTFITDMAGKSFAADKSDATDILAPIQMGKAEKQNILPTNGKRCQVIYIDCYLEVDNNIYYMRPTTITNYKEARLVFAENKSALKSIYPNDLMGNVLFHGDLKAQYLWDVAKIAGLPNSMALEGIAAHYTHHINYFINNGKAYRGIYNNYVQIYKNSIIEENGIKRSLFDLETERLGQPLSRLFPGDSKEVALDKYLLALNLLEEKMSATSTTFYDSRKFSMTANFATNDAGLLWQNMVSLRESEQAKMYRRVKLIIREIDPFVHNQTEADDVAQLARGGLTKWSAIQRNPKTIANTHPLSLSGPGKNYLVSTFALQETDDFLAMLANNSITAKALGRRIKSDLTTDWGDLETLQAYYKRIQTIPAVNELTELSVFRSTVPTTPEKMIANIAIFENLSSLEWNTIEPYLFQGAIGQISKQNLEDNLLSLRPFLEDMKTNYRSLPDMWQRTLSQSPDNMGIEDIKKIRDDLNAINNSVTCR